MGRLSGFFHYETVQIVRIRNVRVSLIHMFVQLAILGYIIGYGLIWKKAYQATGQVVGTADIKVKGVGYTAENQTLPWYGPNANASFHVYDSYDLIMPATEENALFTTTNMWVTKNQTREICPSYGLDNTCTTDADCIPMKYVNNGRQTGLPGSCRINYTDPQQLWPVPKGGFCDVYAWCPTELEETDPTLNTFKIHGVDAFTVFVRMNVNFPTFGHLLDNTRGSNTTTNHVNLWTLHDMVHAADWTWQQIQSQGITIGMNAVWDCDFDKGVDACVPTITFTRLDNPNSNLSHGFNFRSIEYFHDKWGSRQLTKHYGVRLLVLISGVGRQFDIAALLTAVGAGIGLLSVATLVADFIATNLLHNKDIYKQAKYKEVEVPDDGEEATDTAEGQQQAEGQPGSSSSRGGSNADLKTPLRSNAAGGSAIPKGSSAYGSSSSSNEKVKRGSEGQLHIAHPPPYDDDDDDEEEVRKRVAGTCC